MKKLNIIFFLVFFISSSIFATPSIDSIIYNGSSIVINSGASNFTEKTTAAPIKFDDFETGINGEPISNGWSYHVVDEGFSAPYYTNSSVRSPRSLSVRTEFSSKNSSVFYKSDETSDKPVIYTTFFIRVTRVDPEATTGNYKYVYITSSATSFAGALPRLSFQGNAGNYYMTMNSDNGGESFDSYTSTVLDTGWIRVELYGKESSGGITKDGKIRLVKQTTNGSEFVMSGDYSGHLIDACQTRDTDHWVNVHFGIYAADRTGTPDTFYYDYSDIYIDNSWARVEIGNASTWATCTHREIQIPTAWATDEITITANEGSFETIAGNYLYVIDSDGNVSDGFLIPSDITPPTVTAFAIPATYTSIPVPVTTFTATDYVGVTGYIVTVSSTAPAYTESGWTPSPPTELDFLSEGANTVYAWAKDAAGNVSTSATDDCTVTLPEPGVTWEVQPTWSVTWEDQPTWQTTWE